MQTIDHYHATGVLILGTVTPVIKAVFGGYQLGSFDAECEGVPRAHHVSIAKLSQAAGPFWGDVLIALVELATTLPVDSKCEPQPNEGALRRLVARYTAHSDDPAVSADIIVQLLERSDPKAEIDLPSLFLIAGTLDDGHALQGILFEGSWYGAKLGLGAFSGHGAYISERVCVEMGSTHAVQLGLDLDTAIAARRFEVAAQVLANEVRALLGMIIDPDVREFIDDELMGLLWADAAVDADEVPAKDSGERRLLM